MSFCKDCTKGVRHEGTPEGKIEKIGGIETYVATPTVDYPKDAAIIFWTDVFGIALPNNRLLADDFAKNGFKVYMPNLFYDDPLSPDAFSDPNFDIMKWFPNHKPDDIQTEIVKPFLAAIEEQGVKKYALTGYCFGARLSFDIAFSPSYKESVKAIAVAHPSLLKFPDDFEKYKETNVPLLINSCEIDQQFPLENQPKVDEILKGFAPGYKREYFAGCTHGFAVRGDLSDPKVKAGKEGAFTATVLWFLEHLK